MSGLVGFWPLHEWNGDAADLSGEGNDGTVTGATQGVWGRGGLTGYSFDGTDDHISITGVPDLSSYTVSFWARLEAMNTGTPQVFYSDRLNNDIIVREDGGAWEFSQSQDDNTTFTISTGATPDVWVHLALTWDGSTMEAYKDASSVGTDTPSSMRGLGRQHLIGAQDDGGGGQQRYFGGYGAGVRLYNRALSASEIQTLYDWGTGDYTKQSLHDGTDSGAVSRYRFASGATTTDSWGSNTLTDNTSAGKTTDAIRGEAKSFDGSDDGMTPGSPSSLDNLFDGGGTLALWFNWSSNQYIASSDENTNGWIINQAGDNRNIIFNRRFSTNIGTWETPDDMGLTGGWYHLVIVYDSSSDANSPTIYVNGRPTNVTESSTPSGTRSDDSADNKYFGRLGRNGLYWGGDLDDVRIYSRMLSHEEVADLYRWGTLGRDMRARTVVA